MQAAPEQMFLASLGGQAEVLEDPGIMGLIQSLLNEPSPVVPNALQHDEAVALAVDVLQAMVQWVQDGI